MSVHDLDAKQARRLLDILNYSRKAVKFAAGIELDWNLRRLRREDSNFKRRLACRLRAKQGLRTGTPLGRGTSGGVVGHVG